MDVTMNDIFYAVLTVIVPLVLRYTYQLVRDTAARKDAVSAVYTAVNSVMQTFVDDLKQTGCFTPEAAERAFQKAREEAFNIMQVNTRKWLEKAYTDLDSWFEVQIESAVRIAKGEV